MREESKDVISVKSSEIKLTSRKKNKGITSNVSQSKRNSKVRQNINLLSTEAVREYVKSDELDKFECKDVTDLHKIVDKLNRIASDHSDFDE